MATRTACRITYHLFFQLKLKAYLTPRTDCKVFAQQLHKSHKDLIALDRLQNLLEKLHQNLPDDDDDDQGYGDDDKGVVPLCPCSPVAR